MLKIGVDFLTMNPMVWSGGDESSDRFGYLGELDFLLQSYQLGHDTSLRREVERFFKLKARAKSESLPPLHTHLFIADVSFIPPYPFSYKDIFEQESLLDHDRFIKDMMEASAEGRDIAFLKQLSMHASPRTLLIAPDHSIHLAGINGASSGIDPREIADFIFDKHTDYVPDASINTANNALTINYALSRGIDKVFVYGNGRGTEGLVGDIRQSVEKGAKYAYISIDLDCLKDVSTSLYHGSDQKPVLDHLDVIDAIKKIRETFPLRGADVCEFFLRHTDYEECGLTPDAQESVKRIRKIIAELDD